MLLKSKQLSVHFLYHFINSYIFSSAETGSLIHIPLMVHFVQPSSNRSFSTQMAAAMEKLCNRPGFSCKNNAPRKAAPAAKEPLGLINFNYYVSSINLS